MLVYDIMMYITLFQALKIILKSISLSTSPRLLIIHFLWTSHYTASLQHF